MNKEALDPGRRPTANPGDAHASVLIGIKRQDWRTQSEAALNLGRKLANRGEIAYCVVSEGELSPAATSTDLRAHPRTRTRLRSAKLLDGGYRFISESRICDRSRDGLRLALAHDIALPPRLAVHIDETSEVRKATIIWRRGSTVGIRLQGALPDDAMTASRRSALRERYYAIPV
jgi:hypothetical protein